MPNARHEFCDSVGRGFYLVSVPYFRTGGHVISTCISIVCAPKSQLSIYPAWENFNITMDIGETERTRVPLESWKNKESVYRLKSEKRLFIYLFLSR